MTATAINPVTRQLADRLVAIESEALTVASEDRIATCRVCERLRRSLSHLVGITGFSLLMQRALSLAQRESQALIGVEVMADGSLAGLEGASGEASPILVAHLTHLLMSFIGEGLTLTLLQDIWPEAVDLVESPRENGYEK